MNTIEIQHRERVVCVTLNRPDVLNALNAELRQELIGTLQEMDQSPDVGCIVVTGRGRAFAAGADIEELAGKSHLQVCREDLLADWQGFANLRTPTIAAVNGYALGGGCELAMMCDMIIASDNARFGQPEIKLGLIPGMGGTQRLTRLIGKAKTMDMILTGRMMDAAEALQAGLVSRIYPADTLVEEAMNIATTIAGFSKHSAIAARESVDHSLECGLAAGLIYERRNYHSLWATDDAHEGMQAFLERREAKFQQ
jgi:enoyl-CoA hydratase